MLAIYIDDNFSPAILSTCIFYTHSGTCAEIFAHHFYAMSLSNYPRKGKEPGREGTLDSELFVGLKTLGTFNNSRLNINV